MKINGNNEKLPTKECARAGRQTRARIFIQSYSGQSTSPAQIVMDFDGRVNSERAFLKQMGGIELRETNDTERNETKRKGEKN